MPQVGGTKANCGCASQADNSRGALVANIWPAWRGMEHAVQRRLHVVPRQCRLLLCCRAEQKSNSVGPSMPAASGRASPQQELLCNTTWQCPNHVLGASAAALQPDGGLTVTTASGKKIPADMALLVIGVRPETSLAKAAGLALGQSGGIQVDEHMRTSDKSIYAVGE